MSEWREIQGRFTSFDRTRIHHRRLIPRDATRYTVILVHGLGEHAGRYGNLYDYFVPSGYEFYAPDLRGHGLSEGGRGHVQKFTEYLDDIDALMAKIDEERPKNCGIKGGNILIGHSMGGLIALRYALDRPDGLCAVLVSGPLLEIAVPVPAWKTALGNIVSGIVPKFSMPNEVDPNLLSHDPQVVRRYEEDPLVHNMVSARWYTEMTAAMEDVHRRAGEFKLPVLIMHGREDKLTNPQGSIDFYNKCGARDKTLKIYDGFYHEIFNELRHKKVLADIEAWLKERNL